MDKIPLALVIRVVGGETVFNAFSPNEFDVNRGEYHAQTNAFLERINNMYRAEDGVIFHIYVKGLEQPLIDRGDVCYFSTYNHLINGQVVLYEDINILFVLLENDIEFRNSQHNLIHRSCIHALI